MTNQCPACMDEIAFCTEHQKADIEYEKIKEGDVDKLADPAYIALLEKYGASEYD